MWSNTLDSSWWELISIRSMYLAFEIQRNFPCTHRGMMMAFSIDKDNSSHDLHFL
jgi:hypothetical protein